MSAIIAHGAVVGGDSPWMLIWFGMFLFGILFIALALRDDSRDREKDDDSIPDLQDLRDLPLRNVREAIKPKPAKRTSDPANGPRSRAPHRTRGPRGLVP